MTFSVDVVMIEFLRVSFSAYLDCYHSLRFVVSLFELEHLKKVKSLDA